MCLYFVNFLSYKVKVSQSYPSVYFSAPIVMTALPVLTIAMCGPLCSTRTCAESGILIVQMYSSNAKELHRVLLK